MIIYALFHETNGDDGQIEALYLNEGDAEAARLAAIRAARDAGLRIYFDPDSGDDCADWDHNWRVDAETVHTAPPDVACPSCGDTGHRAYHDDAPAAVACSGCGRVGMVPAQCGPADHENSSGCDPNPIAVVVADMVRTMNETAPKSGADAIAELTEQIETLASVIGIEVQIN